MKKIVFDKTKEDEVCFQINDTYSTVHFSSEPYDTYNFRMAVGHLDDYNGKSWREVYTMFAALIPKEEIVKGILNGYGWALEIRKQRYVEI